MVKYFVKSSRMRVSITFSKFFLVIYKLYCDMQTIKVNTLNNSKYYIYLKFPF